MPQSKASKFTVVRIEPHYCDFLVTFVLLSQSQFAMGTALLVQLNTFLEKYTLTTSIAQVKKEETSYYIVICP